MIKVICEDCSTVFEAKVSAFLCPDCRKRRYSEAAKRRNLSELGHEGYRRKLARRAANGSDR